MKKNANRILIFIAIGAMLLCTKSSPLYPFNDWGDANIYFTMGKGMLNGQVPYRDLFDHKGPLIYALYGLASLISSKSFLGVWILEIVAAFFFLLYSYKILKLFCLDKAITIMPIYAAVVYAANHMRHGGSAEELCLPFLVYGLYVLTKWVVKKERFCNKELIFLGITSGCVLWIKYTMLGFYIGWIILPAITMIYKKEYKELFRIIRMIAVGVVLVTIPTLLYFLIHNSLGDLFTVYFYNNIFVYTGESVSFIEVIIRTLWNTLRAAGKNIFIFGFIVLGVVWLLLEKNYWLLVSLITCIGGMALTVLTAETVHGYYSMCFGVFGIFGILATWEALNVIYNKYVYKFIKPDNAIKILAVISTIGMFLFAYITGYNSDFILYNTEELPQYQFAKIMNENDNPTLLNYGFLDGGFYTVADISPSCKYFFEANMDLDEMKIAQKDMIEEGKVDFVVTFDEQYNWPKYKLIADAEFIMEGNNVTYYLYQLK